MTAIARWCFRRRFLVIATWVIVLIGLGALAQGAKSSYDNSFSLPGTGSTMAQQLLAKSFPAQAGDSDTIVWPVSQGTVGDPAVAARAGTEVIQVIPRTSPEDKATSDLSAALRGTVIPAAEHGTTLLVYAGGITARFADFASSAVAKLLWFLVTIVVLSFHLLVMAFRSLLIPAKVALRKLIPATAALRKLIAAVTAFRVLTAFFQWGWGSHPLGLGKAGPIESFLPLVTLAILFGLSMDYQVFLVSRMTEEWVHGRKNRRAVRMGQGETGRVITAAATIMICLFTAFSVMGTRGIAEVGVGLAAADALDAFILRTVRRREQPRLAEPGRAPASSAGSCRVLRHDRRGDHQALR